MIEPLSRAVRDYLAGFNLGAILVSSTGEISVARDLARVSSVAALWWTRDRATAHQVVRAIGERHPGSVEAAVAEIQAAAVRVDVVLSEHSVVVVARAQAAAEQLQGKLEAARQSGGLAFLNREYQRRRLEAERLGRRFMSYGEAQRRLRKALVSAAATGSMPEIMAAVFGD
jgi:hypothetical protein